MTEFTFQHLRFDFNNVNLRVIGLNGQPWFVAVDVCNVLNGSTTGSTKAFIRLSVDEVMVVRGQR